MPQDIIKSLCVNSIKPENMRKVYRIKKTHEYIFYVKLMLFY